MHKKLHGVFFNKSEMDGTLNPLIIHAPSRGYFCKNESIRFRLLDWRHEFGNAYAKAGDVYYDLAKMNHNLTVNHDIICRDLYDIKINQNEVFVDILRKDSLVQCNKVFLEEIEKLGYNINKVEMLTGIVWLNMSSLHHHPFSEFLFYYGKLKLYLATEEYYAKQNGKEIF